ncbi:hypothetical protein MAR_014155 [Mya arenaria]|uniref:Uncharacterized protein n=1 Tax=Mya arenaria TaxID=6604 RepID=A0ABY7G4Y9_MYAAR|nr:hypothetical protein MAR_014088 [Mya arenaria]WAR28451.1 hypothetical protein MAR_014155 [Mya arenaria]
MEYESMILQHQVPEGKTVNATYYQKDNAHWHRAAETLLTIDFLGFECLKHAPYSPDCPNCAPMDFTVFVVFL